MNTIARKSFIFTGWHMAAILLAFFGTVISVNLLMAYYATSSWSGLVVENTYVASQQFNGKAASIRAMLATGIIGKLSVGDGEIRYNLAIPGKGPVDADSVIAHFKRPVGEHQDFIATLSPTGNGDHVAAHAVLPGHWIVEVISTKDGKVIMHEANRISVHQASK
ncbi:MAG: FixH family protein [Allorhizobium sp.]